MSINPILITGADHCGTTWIGKILSLAHELGYIHEPFNPKLKWGTNWLDTKCWYRYYSPSEVGPASEYQRTLSWEYNFKKAVEKLESPKDVLHMSKDMLYTYKNNVCQSRAVVKDPIAVLSVPWLIKNFDMNVVVIVRHPAGFVSSRVSKNLFFPFDDLLSQRKLVNEKLIDFKEEIKKQVEKPSSVIGQSSLLWRIIYSFVNKYISESDSIIVRYEDICINPVVEFKALYQRLNLKWSDKISKYVQKYSSGNNAARISKDSRKHAFIFRKRLTSDQIERIKRETVDIWPLFYTSEDW